MRQNSMLNHNNNNTNINSSLIFQYSNIHFENVYYLLQHYLHSPDTYATNFSYLLQVPLFLVDTNAFNSIKHQLDTILILNSTSDSNKQNNQQSVNKTQQQHYNLFQNLNLNSSQSDLLVKIYFDFYLKLFALFSYQVKYRKEFLFINFDQAQKFENFMKLETDDSLTTATTTAKNNWELIDQDGDAESLEQTLIDISEDDLIKLYYQIPFNSIFSFLWAYLSFQLADNSNPTTSSNSGNNKKQKLKETNSGNEFRKRYVIMKILSFLDNLSKLSIRTLLVYNRTKYKNFSKLIGKTLKDSIKFASLIITNFVDVQEQEAEKFYQHYDMFVNKRIFATIIYSTRVKSIRWTLLSQLNISQLCLGTKWLILSIMTGIDVFHVI